jgi:3-phenylpropionate/trans-cinnamate dioxygenase ferredoxin component
MAEQARVKVGRIEEIPAGEGRVVDVGGQALAVFNVDGRFYAIDNRCVHRDGPLGEGLLDGHVVMCPWHGWRFDVRSGKNVNNPAVAVPCFPVTVEDGSIYVEVAC